MIQPDSDHLVECRNGVAVSVSAAASDVALSVLKQGGNAVDAAIALAFALQVTYPISGAMGGGGFMLVHPAPGAGDPVVFDYRECAPAAAWPTMYTKKESQYTHRAVAVPGTIRGLELAHRRFGSLAWAKLIQPAVALARDGFIVDRHLAKSANATMAVAPEFAEMQRVYGKPGGGQWAEDDRMVLPDLARTLQLLADLGPDAFYTGPIAEAIVAEMTRGNGLITAQDLANYRAIERKPLTTRYRGGYDVFVPPPPCAGGTCLLEEINILANFDNKCWGRWSPKTIHVMAEAMRRANCDRARYLGDPAFVQIPEKLITPDYARELAATIDMAKATRSRNLAPDIPMLPDTENTTHFSIIDAKGMAVANTFTLERRWGSRVVVKKMGFLLNNDMRAFNLFPGASDSDGNIGTAPNVIAPGKRPLSSQTPTIVAKDGRVKLVTGTPGSQSIPHTILGILMSTFDFDLPLKTAVEAPRFTHQWLPDQITYEDPEKYPELVNALKAMGHKVERMEPVPQGDAHSIWVVKPNHYIGVADKRISGKAAGY
ncbi:MAG TPA: gamma-glutamyltransferase [Planctomycetota bacterium]|nr:gamma-glutamyltransferase [Planctomycetota bacterium]